MKHDKKSFLAGLSVGVALKGWATFDSGQTIITSISTKVVNIPQPPSIIPALYVAAGIPGKPTSIPTVGIPRFVYSFEEVPL